MSRWPKCEVCGKQGGFFDAHKTTFCTNECYQHYKEASRCVPHFSLTTLLRNDDFRSIVYTDNNMQVVTMRLKPGERIGDEKDTSKPEVHSKSTQTIIVFEGGARVTIYSNDIPYPFVIRSGQGENMTVIPRDTFHLIENIGETDLRLITIYSPPVHITV